MNAAQPSNWTMVVAIANNGVIGNAGGLPWRLRSDLKRFKAMTMGHCLLMGRHTMQSIGRGLPGRQTIVLSRSGYEGPAGIQVTDDPAKVPDLVEPGRDVMVVGGSQIYMLTLPMCDRIWLTRVLGDVPGDTCFPEIDWDVWEKESSTPVEAGEHDQFATEFQVWKRRRESK